MYAVVGCSDCQALWIVTDRPETSQCPRCGKTRKHAKRKKFVVTEDRDHAREVRASLLADRQGYGDAFEQMDSVAEMDTQTEEAVVDDETYLEESGLDADEVAEAGQRAEESRSGGSSPSRQEVVREALRELENPGITEIVAYAGEHGVEADYVEKALGKLVRTGEVSESRGTYRLV